MESLSHAGYANAIICHSAKIVAEEHVGGDEVAEASPTSAKSLLLNVEHDLEEGVLFLDGGGETDYSDSKMNNPEFYQSLASLVGLRIFKDSQRVLSTSSLPTIHPSIHPFLPSDEIICAAILCFCCSQQLPAAAPSSSQ